MPERPDGPKSTNAPARESADLAPRPHVLLHIGLAKTGTSALQHMLQDNRQTLLERGVVYPQSGLSGPGQHELGLSLIDENGRPADPQTADRVLRDIRDEILASGAGRAIVSSEYLSLARDVERIREAWSDLDVDVLVCLRGQQALMNSLYQQKTKSYENRFPGTPKEYLEVLPSFYLDYEELLAPWADAFGRDHIRVMVYEDLKTPRDIHEVVLEMVGIPLDRAIRLPQDPRQVNATIGTGFGEVLRLTNSLPMTREQHDRLTRSLFDLQSRTWPGFLGEWDYYGGEEWDELLDRYDAGNERGMQLYTARPVPLRARSGSDRAGRTPGLTEEDLASALTWLLFAADGSPTKDDVSFQHDRILFLLRRNPPAVPAPLFLHIGTGNDALLDDLDRQGWRTLRISPKEDPARTTFASIEDLPPLRAQAVCIEALPEPKSTLRRALYGMMTRGVFDRNTLVFGLPHLVSQAGSAHHLIDEFTDLGFRFRNEGGGVFLFGGSSFADFAQERYVPGMWGQVSAYEHLPRYFLARRLAEGKRVLDFACGSGYGSGLLSEVAQSVTGVDVSPDALQWARSHHEASNITFHRSTNFAEELPEAAFDVVTCFEVIEHLQAEQQQRMLSSLARRITPEGVLVCSTPNPAVTAMYGDNEFHLRELTLREFLALLRERFAHVRLLEQKIVSASVIAEADEPDAVACSFGQVANLPAESVNSIAYVALCSHTALPDLTGFAWFDTHHDWVAADLHAQRRYYDLAFEKIGRPTGPIASAGGGRWSRLRAKARRLAARLAHCPAGPNAPAPRQAATVPEQEYKRLHDEYVRVRNAYNDLLKKAEADQ